jgi:hypothetical protein
LQDWGIGDVDALVESGVVGAGRTNDPEE